MTLKNTFKVKLKVINFFPPQNYTILFSYIFWLPLNYQHGKIKMAYSVYGNTILFVHVRTHLGIIVFNQLVNILDINLTLKNFFSLSLVNLT